MVSFILIHLPQIPQNVKREGILQKSRLQKQSGILNGDRIDTAQAASGEAKEKAGLRTQIASRLSLMVRGGGLEPP